MVSAWVDWRVYADVSFKKGASAYLKKAVKNLHQELREAFMRTGWPEGSFTNQGALLSPNGSSQRDLSA